MFLPLLSLLPVMLLPLLILMKLLRIKQLEDLEGGAKVSEGADAGYMDMANYALFALIHLESA